MNTAQRNNLVRYAEAHGVKATIRESDGAVLVYTPWIDGEGKEGLDCDRVRNMRELRQLLGY